MEPIISPMFIYLLSIVGNLEMLFTIMYWLSVVYFIILFMTKHDYDDHQWVKHMRYNTICFILFVMLSIFIPTKETLIAMYVSKYITVNNIKLGKEIMTDTVKEIISIINKEDK